MAEGELSVEDVKVAAEAIPEFVKSVRMIEVKFAAIGFVVTAGTGAAAGWFFTRKKAERHYRALADVEISVMREHFHNRAKSQEPKPALEELTKAYRSSYDEEPKVVKTVTEDAAPTSPPVQYHNAFEEQPEIELPEWDYAHEIKSRDETQPYIIHLDEYTEGNLGHDRQELTYFVGDDVLSDERDVPIDNRDAMVGDENLERFGHGSQDPNTLYIRNEVLGLDIEISRSEGKYATEVAGFTEDELKHSDKRYKPQRGYDDD